MILLAVILLFGAGTGAHATSKYMECGSGVSMCGVLTLETGKGHGNYKHDGAAVHGLWCGRNIYIYIYSYIYSYIMNMMCVCVCVCEERNMRETDCVQFDSI